MERGWKSPCLRQPSKQVAAIVLLGVFLGKVFQVPFGELLLRENNDCFREVSSVNSIPQVSGFPAPVTFSFDDGSGFQDQRSLLLTAGNQETPRCQPHVPRCSGGTRDTSTDSIPGPFTVPQILPTTPDPACFTEEESGAQRGK